MYCHHCEHRWTYFMNKPEKEVKCPKCGKKSTTKGQLVLINIKLLKKDEDPRSFMNRLHANVS